MIERTLVLIKPDGVQRCLSGRVISRFEDAGLKIVGMKMIFADKEMAKKHYTEDITKRKGEFVRNKLLEMFSIGPMVAICLEGIKAISNVRKLVGTTEGASALPGTIRGDFSHATYDFVDEKKQALRNIIHASGDEKDAKYEVDLWFKPEELHTYKTVHDIHILHE